MVFGNAILPTSFRLLFQPTLFFVPSHYSCTLFIFCIFFSLSPLYFCVFCVCIYAFDIAYCSVCLICGGIHTRKSKFSTCKTNVCFAYVTLTHIPVCQCKYIYGTHIPHWNISIDSMLCACSTSSSKHAIVSLLCTLTRSS